MFRAVGYVQRRFYEHLALPEAKLPLLYSLDYRIPAYSFTSFVTASSICLSERPVTPISS